MWLIYNVQCILQCKSPSQSCRYHFTHSAKGRPTCIISILLKYQSLCVCLCVCPAMRFAMLRRSELKVGMGVGDGPTRFVGIFLKLPHLGSKVIQGSICLRNALWLPNLVRRTPDQSVVHCWGQRSCRGQLGSSRGQFA